MATCFHPRRCQEGNHDLSSCKGGHIPIFLPFVVLIVVFGNGIVGVQMVVEATKLLG